MPDELQHIIEQDMVALEAGELSNRRARMDDLLGQAGRVQLSDQASYAKSADLVKIMTSDISMLNESRLTETKKPRMYVDWINAEFKKITDPLEAAIKAVKRKRVAWADKVEQERLAAERKARKKAEDEALACAKKAEDARVAAVKIAQEARDAEEKAKALGNTSVAEIASQTAADAEQEASEHGAEAERILNAAANVPEVDVAVRKVRSCLGTVSGTRKVWKVEVLNLHAFMRKAESYMSELVSNDPKVKEAVRKAVQKSAISKFEGNGIPIPGLRVHQVSEDSVR